MMYIFCPETTRNKTHATGLCLFFASLCLYQRLTGLQLTTKAQEDEDHFPNLHELCHIRGQFDVLGLANQTSSDKNNCCTRRT